MECVMVTRGVMCAIVRVKDIEMAETICKEWNNFKFKENQVMKVHIHPLSYTKRDNLETSHHQIFQRQKALISGGGISYYKESELSELMATLKDMVQ